MTTVELVTIRTLDEARRRLAINRSYLEQYNLERETATYGEPAWSTADHMSAYHQGKVDAYRTMAGELEHILRLQGIETEQTTIKVVSLREAVTV